MEKRIFTCVSTKGGVGKTMVLQQLVLPAVAELYNEQVLYVDLDELNANSVYVENSRYIKGIEVLRLESESDMKRCHKFLLERCLGGEVMVLDTAGNFVVKKLLNLLYSLLKYSYVFVVEMYDHSSSEDAASRAIGTLSNMGKISGVGNFYALVRNMVPVTEYRVSDVIQLIDMGLIREFINGERLTAYEISPVEYKDDELKRAWADLVEFMYVPVIRNEVKNVKSVIVRGNGHGEATR